MCGWSKVKVGGEVTRLFVDSVYSLSQVQSGNNDQRNQAHEPPWGTLISIAFVTVTDGSAVARAVTSPW
jgi:hypothetical protein